MLGFARPCAAGVFGRGEALRGLVALSARSLVAEVLRDVG